MRCTRVEKFLPLYVAGDLAGRRAARRVKNHLATCERCRGLAAEYDASRDLVRAATLPPDFDAAFYDELRSSVLAEIKRGRTGLAASPPLAGFASFFNARFAYAASFVLIIATVAALSLYSYVNRKSEADARRSMIANVNGERTGTTAATPFPTQATTSGVRRSSTAFDVIAEKNASEGPRAAKPLLPAAQRHANGGKAQSETQRSVGLAKYALHRARRNPLAPFAGAGVKNTEEIARSSNSSGGGTMAAPEVSRIEIQTSDPNIRIIWLSPKTDAVAEPLK